MSTRLVVTLRWVAGTAAALLVATTVFGGFVLYSAGWGSGEPYFGLPPERVMCFDSHDEPQDRLSITFSSGGRTALIESSQSRATVEFVGGGMARDLYRGEGVELYINPEIFVRGLDGINRGPCVGTRNSN